jgi:hypothetical protein
MMRGSQSGRGLPQSKSWRPFATAFARAAKGREFWGHGIPIGVLLPAIVFV